MNLSLCLNYRKDLHFQMLFLRLAYYRSEASTSLEWWNIYFFGLNILGLHYKSKSVLKIGNLMLKKLRNNMTLHADYCSYLKDFNILKISFLCFQDFTYSHIISYWQTKDFFVVTCNFSRNEVSTSRPPIYIYKTCSVHLKVVEKLTCYDRNHCEDIWPSHWTS